MHELKYDGYRIGCRLERGRARLLSRRGLDWTARFPEIARAAEALPAREALLDGEAAIALPDGRTSFQALQNAFQGGSRRGLAYFAFDLLHLDGEELARWPLVERKAALAALLDGGGGVLRYVEHFSGDGPGVWRQACRLGAEGIVSKRADLPHRAGRNASWLKVKCAARQELVVGGFTDLEGSRVDLGSILVGHRARDGRLQFAGKVGAGFGTRADARRLRARLAALEQPHCPFQPPPRGWLARHAHWTRPELVAEVAFTEWTADGKVRHPAFRGLRQDRAALEVVREEPAAEAVEVSGVRISHPHRVVDAGTGTTKLDLARYYDAVAEAMLPHLAGRPLTLVHCPAGIAGGCRFMKHSKLWAPAAVRRVRIREKTKVGEYLVVDGREALLSVIQMGVVELHTWNARVGRLEEPDRIVVDLDPGPRVAWAAVVAAAREVRAALRALGLESFVKTTGGTGLHVVVPVLPQRDWREVLLFARRLATALHRGAPRRYTTSFAPRDREGTILIDYLRNNRTNTSVAAFSARARAGLPVSVPVEWDELDPRRPPRFDVRTVPRRLARLARDPWREYGRARQRLGPAALRAVEAVAGG